MGVGSDTLRRTCFVVGMASLYTNLVHTDADANSKSPPYRREPTRTGAKSCWNPGFPTSDWSSAVC
jgi:hypothetical protein